jgi:hypothetical protein
LSAPATPGSAATSRYARTAPHTLVSYECRTEATDHAARRDFLRYKLALARGTAPAIAGEQAFEADAVVVGHAATEIALGEDGGERQQVAGDQLRPVGVTVTGGRAWTRRSGRGRPSRDAARRSR